MTTTLKMHMPYSARLSLLAFIVLQLSSSSSSSCVVSLASVAATKPPSSSAAATTTTGTAAGGGTSTATTLLEEEDVTKKNVHVPVGKDGEGEYTASTKGCFDVIHTARPLILQEIVKQQQQRQQRQQSDHQSTATTTSSSSAAAAYHIADYGTADGGTSLGLIHDMVETLRGEEEEETKGRGGRGGGRGRNNDLGEREVVVHYEDQVTNEWQSVFRHALGHKAVYDAYGTKIPTPYDLHKVFVEACGVGFHSQCYPSSSIDFGVSFTAMHWLSRPDVVSLKGTPFMHPAQVADIDDHNDDSDESCRSALPESIQGSKDWISILEARKAELKQGGRFVCVNFCVSKQGHYLGNTGVGSNMWDSFKQSWEQLYEEGLIDDDERYGVSFPSYYRTMDDFMKGIEEVGGFKIVSAEEKIVPCPYRTLYTETDKKNTMTPREYAEWFVPTTKSWSHSTFKAALLGPSSTSTSTKRTEEEKEMIVNKFWDNYMSLVEQDPSSHGMDYVHAYLVLEKL